MKPAKFKRLLSSPQVQAVLDGVQAIAPEPFAVLDVQDGRIYGEGRIVGRRHDIIVDGQAVGSVVGTDQLSFVAEYLTALAQEALARKNVAAETLERYKEISMLYSLGEKMTRVLDTTSLADLIVEESLGHIAGDFAALFINETEAGLLWMHSLLGEPRETIEEVFAPGDGLIGKIYQSQQAEIINDAAGDPRNGTRSAPGNSLMIAPLKVQDHNLGVAVIGTREEHTYAASDLKLFTAIASQGAFALDNSLLYASKLEEDRIKKNLERYVPAQLVETIIDAGGDISLEPHSLEIAVLFSDIRDFTRRCENLPAADIVGYLNSYFSEMVEMIFRNQGTINKFVGDMIVALFGAPRQVPERERRAVQAAIDMQKRMAAIDDAWIRDNFHTGIGINAGEVVVGNIGSHQHMDYTAIGDEVNVASRLQSLAKGGQILVTERIMEKTADHFEYREFHESITLKGKEKPVHVFEVIFN